MRWQHWPIIRRVYCWWVQRRVTQCGEKRCYTTKKKHQVCVNCGAITCNRIIRVDDRGSRRKRFVCLSCEVSGYSTQKTDGHLYARTGKAWAEMTTPVNGSALSPVMGEQYPSRARDAVRAFWVSGDTFATVSLDVSTLEGSIASLGLSKYVYAEQRGNQTALRLVELEDLTR